MSLCKPLLLSFVDMETGQEGMKEMRERREKGGEECPGCRRDRKFGETRTYILFDELYQRDGDFKDKISTSRNNERHWPDVTLQNTFLQ